MGYKNREEMELDRLNRLFSQSFSQPKNKNASNQRKGRRKAKGNHLTRQNHDVRIPTQSITSNKR